MLTVRKHSVLNLIHEYLDTYLGHNREFNTHTYQERIGKRGEISHVFHASSVLSSTNHLIMFSGNVLALPSKALSWGGGWFI